MTKLVCASTAILIALCVTGCATQSVMAPSAVVTSPNTKTVDPGLVTDAVSIGKSTKADVIAALGETLVIRFDNGYEVWVYRLADDNAAGSKQRPVRDNPQRTRRGESAEFVILFPPSGPVAKTRLRPLPPSPSR
jgi:hypothetical protein